MEEKPNFKPGPWGLWDTKDNLWLGTEKGPISFEERKMARIAATVSSERVGYPIRATRLPVGHFNLKDVVNPPISSEEAIKRIEGRLNL